MAAQLPETVASLISRLQNDVAAGTRNSNLSNPHPGFLTHKVIREVALEDNVYRILNNELEIAGLEERERHNLARKICKSCPKMFIICLVQDIPLSFLITSAHESDQKYEYTIKYFDSALPLAEDTVVEPVHATKFANRFLPYQRVLLGPSLRMGDFTLNISDGLPLPIWKHQHLGRGSAGIVHSVVIHKDYVDHKNHDLISASAEWCGPFAMKMIARGGDREIHFLQELHLANFNHPHLLKSYFGFTQASALYLISDKADYDLKHVIEETNPADHTCVNREWLKAQMLGLAGALAGVHNLRDSKAGYMLDIKPPNVLVFGAPTSTLKLADWGRANVNALTGHGSHKTFYRGDWPYHPPESVEDGTSSSSRPYDIWSMGCLYLDLLVWFTGGKAGYTDFVEGRKSQPDPSDADESFHFEKFDSGKATTTLKFAVQKTLEHLDTRNVGEWKNVAMLIRTMLRLAPKTRPTAAAVVEALGAMSTSND